MYDYKDLIEYQELLYQYGKAELFFSKSSQVYLEFSSQGVVINESKKTGMSSRIYNKGIVEYRIKTGIGIEKAREVLGTKHPHIILPKIPMATNKIKNVSSDRYVPLDGQKMQKEFLNIYEYIKEELKEEKHLKFMLQAELNKFSLLNTYGVYGEGRRSYFAPGIEINGEEYFYDIFPNTHIFDIKQFIKDLVHFKERKRLRINFHSKNIDTVLFSPRLSGKMLYYFCCCLCANFIEIHQSFYPQNTISLSKNFSVSVNTDNSIIGGDIDGEGVARTPQVIIDKGEIQQILSDLSWGYKYPPTGIAYRFDYSIPATLRPSNLSCLGNEKFINLLKNSGVVLMLHDIPELEQNINLRTLDFSSPVHAEIYKSGEYIGTTPFLLKANILNIFKNILAISYDGKYSLDGSVLCGAMTVPVNSLTLKSSL